MSNLHSFLPELNAFASYHPIVVGGSDQQQKASMPIDTEIAMENSLHSAALANGAEEFRLELAARTEAMEARFKAELELARRDWVEEVGGDLATLIGGAFTGIESRVSQSLQTIMLPFVDRLIQQATLDQFLGILSEALQEDFRDALCLSGPQDLITAVKDKLGAQKFEIVCEPSEATELRAKSKDFTVSTRLKSWMDGLHGDTT